MAHSGYYFRFEYIEGRWIKLTRPQLRKAWAGLPQSLKNKLQILRDIWLNRALYLQVSEEELRILHDIGTRHGFIQTTKEE
jgi:hypothetical protein